MKITALDFGNNDESFIKTLTEALEELSEDVVDIISASNDMDGITERLEVSDGIVLFAPVSLGSPNSAFKAFFERIFDGRIAVFAEKNCMLAFSATGSIGRYAFESAARTLEFVGAHDAVRVSNMDGNELVERLAEDFYRILRQNRKYAFVRSEITAERIDGNLTDDDYEKLLGQGQRAAKQGTVYGGKKRQTAAELLVKRTGGEAPEKAETEEQNVEELTQFFVEKYQKAKEGLELVSAVPIDRSAKGKTAKSPPKPRSRSVKQMSQSLPHVFQPHLAAGLNAVFQINVTGAEKFEHILNISNTDCTVEEGATEDKDITVNVDSKVWGEVLRGKYTAQKAFMIGQIKVRGNFVLLTKFDQLFTLNMT
jgi:putative sterol carrier protein/multimeric flavodoxin WrbA